MRTPSVRLAAAVLSVAASCPPSSLAADPVPGAYIVADLNLTADTAAGSAAPTRGLALDDGRAVFSNRLGLWVTGPAGVGASQLSPSPADEGGVHAVGDRYLVVRGGSLQLTDLTAAGTAPAFPLSSATTSRAITSVRTVAGQRRAYVRATWQRPTGTVTELWTTDGTPPGTSQVTLPSGTLIAHAPIASGVYAIIQDPSGGRTLWFIPAGGGPAVVLARYVVAAGDQNLGVLGGRAYYAAVALADGGNTWVDWADASTGQTGHTGSTPDGTFSIPGDFRVWGELGGRLVVSSAGFRPVDFTDEVLLLGPTDRIRLLDGRFGGASLTSVHIVDGRVMAYVGATRTCSIIDGPGATPRSITAPAGETPSGLTPGPGGLWWTVMTGTVPSAVRRFDLGGTVSTPAIAPPPMTGFYVAGQPWGTAGRLYFPAFTFAQGTELWTSDGAAAGTRIVADLGTVTVGSNPTDFCPVGPRVVFRAVASGTSNALWSTDGTAAGTRQLTAPDGQSLITGDLYAADGYVLFANSSSAANAGTWRSDGTPAGTFRLTDASLTGSGFSSPVLHPAAATEGRTAVFAAYEPGGSALSVWITDGTVTGTRRVAGRPDLQTFSSVHAPLITGGRIYFYATGPGVTQWTQFVIEPGGRATPYRTTSASFLHLSAPFDGRWLYDSATASLEVSDGTHAGTKTLHTWPTPGTYRRIVAGRRVYFPGATVQPNGATLWNTWCSDGTPEGTRQWAEVQMLDGAAVGDAIIMAAVNTGDIYVGKWPDAPVQARGYRARTETCSLGGAGFHVSGGKAYFFGVGPDGSGLFEADGTPEGFRRVSTGRFPPQANQHARWAFAKVGPRVVYSYLEPGIGVELAALDLRPPADCDLDGVEDHIAIALGQVPDANADGVPDGCGCLADWNASGTADLLDVFAFLESWFAGSADFDHAGGTDLLDIFAFLEAWFAGCP